MTTLAIVTTTINSPTEATLKFRQLAIDNNWSMIVVGDLRTPHEAYINLQKGDNFFYLSPDMQRDAFPKLSAAIKFNSIQRRNLGFVAAVKYLNPKVIATVDDDNIPYPNWGKNIHVGSETLVDVYRNKGIPAFDPLSVVFPNDNFWHRGFPVDYITSRKNNLYLGKTKVMVGVQADLWDGDPDIDALCRLPYKPMVKTPTIDPFTAGPQMAPFNSQNTFIDSRIIHDYFMFPEVGRMDDIWGSYLLQELNPSRKVIFNSATVYQERNPQDLVTNLHNELVGYRHTKELLEWGVKAYLKKTFPSAYDSFLIYRDSF